MGGDNQKWDFKDNIITNPKSGKCLDVFEDKDDNGAKVQLYECNGDSNQKWHLKERSIVNFAGNNMCLDIPNDDTSDGNGLHLWKCKSEWNFVTGGSQHFSLLNDKKLAKALEKGEL